jgi:transketolase N-terminal domain/subunit/transketolase C-terminal domain/subunit
LDHLGGGLDLIPALTQTLSFVDYAAKEFTIEHAHTSIGYYSALAARGFLDPQVVIEKFRRGLDIAGHVSWVPGGTQLNGGRLGVMVPVAAGQALGKKAKHGSDAWVVCHTGDAGWISGQALNGFNGADLHGAPLTFVMHRNGIQLSGSNKSIMDKDPRPIIEAMGITILETPTLHDTATLYKAYREASKLAGNGRPSLIYPTGFRSDQGTFVDLNWFGAKYGIHTETQAFANEHKVPMETEVWVPGALMSYRDVIPMLECLFLVNELPGGEGHHDGHMKGRDLAQVLANPMLQLSAEHTVALEALQNAPQKEIITRARPAPGSANLVLPADILDAVTLPEAGKSTSARSGVQEAYAAVAQAHPDNVFVVSCDLDPSTKLAKARTFLQRDHQFELSIEEQVAALFADGLAMSGPEPQLNVVSTFAAFYEGIAREGMELWRYQRNLNGVNEGVNVAMHMSHVGACTGRDHFSGWALDWINLAIGYLPYLRTFYAPADSGAAFVGIRDLAAHYGAHIVGIPRDNLPVLAKQDGSGPLYDKNDAYEAITEFRTTTGATRAILALGAPAFLAEEAVSALAAHGIATDVYIINGLPLAEGALAALLARYTDGIVTVEDGLIGTPESGIRGFAGLVAGAAYGSGVPLDHVGIVDPRIAPAEGHREVWDHFGLTTEALVAAVKDLG